MHGTTGLAAFAVILASCGIDDFEQVITDEATLPAARVAGTPLNPIYGGDFNALELSNEKSFQNQGVKPSDVDGIFVKSIQLEMDTGSNNPSLDRLSIYIDSLEIWVEAPDEPRKTLGRLTEVPEAKTADLVIEGDFATSAADMKGTGLKPYAVAESMKIGADLVLTPQGANPAINIKLTTTVTLLIDVNLLGI